MTELRVGKKGYNSLLIRLQSINMQIRLAVPDKSYNPTLKPRTLFNLFLPVK